MCGENRHRAASIPARHGSPPRVRGKPAPAAPVSPICRITPACAGKTKKRGAAVGVYADHPRVCGENALREHLLGVVYGSPPRVRGKRQHFLHLGHARRITPACAGKTRSSSRYCSTAADHPRVCGENFRPHLFPRRFHGSPPRVRGKRAMRTASRSSSRITPACAGKTSRA